MKKSIKLSVTLFVSIFLTSCSSGDEMLSLDKRQGQSELIQSKLREYAMQGWESNLPLYNSNDNLPLASPSTDPVEAANNDPATVAWREKIVEDWSDLQGEKNLNIMCQLWFEGWLGIGDTFADLFKEHRARTEAMGIKIETIENIRMAEDNRKIINFPKPGKQYSIFTCEATTIFRMARSGLTKPALSTVSFTYRLENNQVKSRFSVGVGLSTEAINGTP
jgi:hypothetical protein